MKKEIRSLALCVVLLGLGSLTSQLLQWRARHELQVRLERLEAFMEVYFDD